VSEAPAPQRILVVRSAIEDFLEPAWVRALRENGHDATLFDTFAHLVRTPPAQGETTTEPLRSPDKLGWWQHRLLFGPRITRANRALIAQVERERPDVVLMYLGHHYGAATIRRLSELSFVSLFHSDDPFGPRKRHPRYRLLRSALRFYHGAHFYRQATTVDARARGMARAETLIDFYRPWVDYPRPGPQDDEAVFIGHFEPGFRVACLSAATRAGLPVRVFSNESRWRNELPEDVRQAAKLAPGLYGEAYREKLTRAKVCLCFLSRWNRDVYTRRVFEVPACGGFLLCERNPFMQSLYEEDREAVYFGSPDELVDKLRYYLTHEAERSAIAAAGHARVLSGGHDIHSRLRSWAATVARWREETRGARCAS
jgi:spore maturation protein CgeB